MRVVQEVRASEVEDAELQQAIARSLQDTKPGSFTAFCTQLLKRDYIYILLYMTVSPSLILLSCKYMTHAVPGVRVSTCMYESVWLHSFW